MENYFSIGEVSRYQNISKQTLIFYDKIGLFRPAYVDPDNGYRYYSASQIDQLDTILIMKRIGFSLKEIREHMQHYNIDSSLAAFRRQVASIDRQIEELRLIRSRVLHRCAQMEASKAYCRADNPVLVEEVGARHILCRDVPPPYTLKEISIATKQCFADSFQEKLPIFFQSGVIVPLAHILAGRYTEATVAFLSIEETDRAPMMAALKKAAGFVRHELGQSMIIRYAPEILFEEDHNIEYGIHIASVLRQVRPEEETNDESSDGQE